MYRSFFPLTFYLVPMPVPTRNKKQRLHLLAHHIIPFSIFLVYLVVKFCRKGQQMGFSGNLTTWISFTTVPLHRYRYVSWVLICRKSKPKTLGICLGRRYIHICVSQRNSKHHWAFITGTDIWAKQKMKELCEILWQFQRHQFCNYMIHIKRAVCFCMSNLVTYSYMHVTYKGLRCATAPFSPALNQCTPWPPEEIHSSMP